MYKHSDKEKYHKHMWLQQLQLVNNRSFQSSDLQNQSTDHLVRGRWQVSGLQKGLGRERPMRACEGSWEKGLEGGEGWHVNLAMQQNWLTQCVRRRDAIWWWSTKQWIISARWLVSIWRSASQFIATYINYEQFTIIRLSIRTFLEKIDTKSLISVLVILVRVGWIHTKLWKNHL